jgi:hypothetical protein
MYPVHDVMLWKLLETIIGTRRTERLFQALEIHPRLLEKDSGHVSRATAAQALNMLLFEDVIRRVPASEAYVRDAMRRGQKLTFDHGALRTVATPCGELPPGEAAFVRILRPLGFTLADVYPLDALGMTGRAYVHKDFPESIAQFFVSELHPERFSSEFQAVVRRVVSSSRDPLPAWAKDLLATMETEGRLPTEQIVRLLPNLLACFDRQHDEPSLLDYERLLRESQEMAWIATEGNAFNHATDRVSDVAAVAEYQKKLGRSVKDTLEISASGRVIQTAFRSAMVTRLFVGTDGALVARTVPGSFHEFITRHEKSPGVLDLGFDAANAQGIFKMTAAASP